MRALVTGGAGFIGSHLMDALLDADEEVVVVDHLAGRHEHNLAAAIRRGAELVRSDAVCGDPGNGADSEDAPIAPLSPYGASKAGAEMYMSCFAACMASPRCPCPADVQCLWPAPGSARRIPASWDLLGRRAREGRVATVFGDGK